MNVRHKTLLKARQTNDPELWRRYRELQNKITQDVRLAKSEYYTEQFGKVKDCKSYWRLIKDASNSRKRQPILAIRKTDGTLETSNKGIANLLNDHFSKVGEKLAMEFLASSQESSRSNLITNVTPTIMQITLSESTISQSLKSLKPKKASGPDKVAPKLLKYAGDTLIPSLLPIYVSSVKSNRVPRLWKTANVTPLFKNRYAMRTCG